MGAEHGGGRRRPVAGRRVGALVPGVRTRQVEVPRQADRLRGVLPRRERDGLRIPQGGAGRARRERAAQVPDAVGVGYALQLGARRSCGTGPYRGPRARRRRLAHGRPQEALPRLRSHPSERPGLKRRWRQRSIRSLRMGQNTRPKYLTSTTLTDPRARWVLPEPTRSAHRPALSLPPAALTRSTTPAARTEAEPAGDAVSACASRDANWRRRPQRAQLQLDRLQPEPQVEGEVAV